MTTLLRVRSRWQGFSGGPGYTVMHFRDFDSSGGVGGDPDNTQASAAIDRVRTFFVAIAGLYPSAVSVQVEAEVDVIEHTTGELIDSLPGKAVGAVTGSTAANFSAPVGAVINWRTGTIRNGRRLRGRTFLVPLSNTVFDTTGTLSDAARSTLSTAAAGLAANTGTPDLFVYGRPSSKGAADGALGVVTSSSVPDMAAVLRSRRD